MAAYMLNFIANQGLAIKMHPAQEKSFDFFAKQPNVMRQTDKKDPSSE